MGGTIPHEMMIKRSISILLQKCLCLKVQRTDTSHPCKWHWLGFLKFTYFEIFKIYAPHMTRDQNLHFYHRLSRKILKYILTIFMKLAKGISRIIYGKHFRIILLCFALINLSSSCKCFISIIRDGACCSRKEKSGANAVLGAPSVKTRAGKILAETEKSFSLKKFSFTKAKIFVFQ